MSKKKKILVLSDHALSTSGVGVQTRHLINGLLEKNVWSFRQFGAAIKHDSYDVVTVSPDFIIKPIDGFGNRDLIRLTLASEQPDIILIFTDPRFFIWLWEMEDEIHQICPIAYWHVWDNRPTPMYNEVLYESTDLINCHSYLTYEMVSELFPEKTNFIPHSIPDNIFFPMPADKIKEAKAAVLGPNKEDHFIAFWMSRNAKRKRSSDLLWSWKLFLEKLQETHGHKNASLLMHTDPLDPEGPNLYMVTEELGISNNVIFSTHRIEFEKINVLHNISDVSLNISYAEGFGLPTLESMQTGTPIIAIKTGGLTRQVVDHRDGSENGVALPVEFRSLVGSQQVPYIYEDYCSSEAVVAALLKVHDLSEKDRVALSEKVRDYAVSEFAYQKTIDLWHDSLIDLSENWRSRHKPWVCETL